MMDLLLQSALSNMCISLALAFVALAVETTAKRPAIAHVLWVLVFVKLVTPPIVMLPVIVIPAPWDRAAMSEVPDTTAPMTGVDRETGTGTFEASRSEETALALWRRIKPVMLLGWLTGSGFILIWSLMRVYRFDGLLRKASKAAPPGLQARGARIATRLGLKSAPTICITTAQLSPLVWWVGGKVRVVIPEILLAQMDAERLQWVLAHELAHVRRRDYLIRWLEWLACVAFWWNPLVWWGRQHLRANEEICCDDLVLSSLNAKPRTYAESLLNAIEHLASPVLRPPAVASEINSGGFLRRRFEMIVSGTTDRSNSRWVQACVLLGAVLVLPVGLTYAQDFDAVGRKLREAVAAGHLSPEQAAAMMGKLKEIAKDDCEGGVEERFEKWIGGVSERIKAAVGRGDLSEKEGWERWHHFKKHELAPKLKDAIAEGSVSEEWVSGLRKGIQQREIAERIKAAVARGDMTEEEAKAKWAEIMEKADKDKVHGED